MIHALTGNETYWIEN